MKFYGEPRKLIGLTVEPAGGGIQLAEELRITDAAVLNAYRDMQFSQEKEHSSATFKLTTQDGHMQLELARECSNPVRIQPGKGATDEWEAVEEDLGMSLQTLVITGSHESDASCKHEHL